MENSAPEVNRLGCFMQDWNHLSKRARPNEGLKRFLRDYSELRPIAFPICPVTTVESAQLRGMLMDIKEPLEQARANGAALNPWTVAGLGQAEVRNAAVLATFFSPGATGDLGARFLAAMLERLAGMPDSIMLKRGYQVRVEHCPGGDASDRVDLTIEGDGFVLGIEIKITAPEGPEQLRRYATALIAYARQRDRKPLLIFLSPRPPTDASVPHLRWRDVAAAARSVLPRSASAFSHNHYLLDAFARHILTFGE